MPVLRKRRRSCGSVVLCTRLVAFLGLLRSGLLYAVPEVHDELARVNIVKRDDKGNRAPEYLGREFWLRLTVHAALSLGRDCRASEGCPDFTVSMDRETFPNKYLEIVEHKDACFVQLRLP